MATRSRFARAGQAVYGFQGRRCFQEIFNPCGILAIWLAKDLTLPRVLADVSAFVAGGYRRIFAKGDPVGRHRKADLDRVCGIPVATAAALAAQAARVAKHFVRWL